MDPHADYATVCSGYIGESLRPPMARMMEHYLKDWSDTIVGYRVLGRYDSKGAALAAEEAFVRERQPIYNVEYNMANPRRIEPWKWREQALDRQRRGIGTTARPAPHLRDDEVAPQAPPARSRRKAAPTARPARQPRPRSAPRSDVRLVTERAWFWWSVLWIVLATVTSWLGQSKVGLPTAWAVGAGMGAASLLVGLMLPAKRRRRQRG